MLVEFSGANVGGLFEVDGEQIVSNVDFTAYFTQEPEITLVSTLK